MLVLILFELAHLAFINASQKDAEKKRGDLLQQSLDSLRARSNEDRNFFEIVRQIITSEDSKDRQALVDELRNFKFVSGETPHPFITSTTTTTPNTKKTKATSALTVTTSTTTTIIRSSSTTTTTRPPSTTTTSTFCVNTSLITTCR